MNEVLGCLVFDQTYDGLVPGTVSALSDLQTQVNGFLRSFGNQPTKIASTQINQRADLVEKSYRSY
jgi:hypothetical protein